MIVNIEDCLEYLAGMRESLATFTIEKTDHTIMTSIARQVFKGTALTDKQFALMQEKLVNYKQQFVEAGVDNFEYVIEQTRQPLRQIDRSKYIKIVDNTIVIRFPFKKSDIILIEQFATVNEGYLHRPGSHEHEFDYNEYNVLNLLDRFSKKDFVIDEELLEVYEKIKVIVSNQTEHLSGIANKQLINIRPALASHISNEVGELSDETFVQFIDRRLGYGFDYIDDNIKHTTTLEYKIASRETPTYQSKPSTESIDAILSALWKLNRFPLLVILDKLNAETQLYELANYYRDILDPKEQSVLFRVEDADAGFNQLVKDRKLNNWVDKDTKVVYISKDKLPKLLINNEWKPTATFSYNSSMDRFVNNFVSFNCDLIVYREEDMSPMRRHSKYYG
tara:strand:- start:529 stop:1707 length:1179 start_codon:yes stop_codon:yes gene_type:complete